MLPREIRRAVAVIGGRVADQHVAIVRFDRRTRERLELLKRVSVAHADMGDEIAFGQGVGPPLLGSVLAHFGAPAKEKSTQNQVVRQKSLTKCSFKWAVVYPLKVGSQFLRVRFEVFQKNPIQLE